MTQAEKLKQAVSLIDQAMEAYIQATEELSKKTGKEVAIVQTRAMSKAEELKEYYANIIGQCVLNDI